MFLIYFFALCNWFVLGQASRLIDVYVSDQVSGISGTDFYCDAYSISGINVASHNATCTIWACGGSTITANLCEICSGDTYLKLLDKRATILTENDDLCDHCSYLTYVIDGDSDTCGSYFLHEGCASSASCSGQVHVTVAPTVETISYPTSRLRSTTAPPLWETSQTLIKALSYQTVNITSLVDTSTSNVTYCNPTTATTNCNLRSAFAYCQSISGGCIINIPYKSSISLQYGQITLLSVSNLILEGHQSVITASDTQKHRFLTLKYCQNIQFRDLTIQKFGAIVVPGANLYGGVIYTQGSKYIVIYNVIFANNIAYLGGVFYMYDTDYTQITNSAFHDNYAGTTGGVIYMDWSNQYTTIKNSTFYKNSAYSGGGVFEMDTANENTVIVDCTFYDISAGGVGGVFYMWSTSVSTNIIRCTFHNIANGVFYILYVNSYTYITDCTFYGVTGSAVIFLGRDNHHTYISGSAFHDNSAGSGSVIYMDNNNDYTYITSCTINGNHATNGGVINMYQNNDYLYIDRSTFYNNYADYGGIIYMTQNNYHNYISSSTFYNNYAKYHGGIIYMFVLDSVYIYSCFFQSNSAQYGGVVYIYGNAYAYDQYSTYTDNVANFGGAFYLKVANGAKALNLLGTKFISNKAYYNGGAINIESDTNSVGIDACEFISNVAYYAKAFETSSISQYGGGGIYIGAGNKYMTIQNSIFTSNIAPFGIGGAIWSYSTNSDLTVTTSRFAQNSASQGGALAIYAYHENMIVSGSVFENNIAVENGGAISIFLNNDFSIANSILDGNIAVNGGSIYADSNNYVIAISGSQILNNIADYGAGAYFGLHHDMVIFTDTNVSNNKGAYNGGGVMCDKDVTITFNYCTFNSNSAGEYGGGIYQPSDTLLIHYSTLDRNSAMSGGAVYFTGDEFEITHSNISSNTVTLIDKGVGGGIYVHDTLACNMVNNTYERNQAALGGAIYLTSTTNTTINANMFSHNVAKLSGAGIYWLHNTMSEPLYLNDVSNYFHDNLMLSGGYGPNFATEASSLQMGSTVSHGYKLLEDTNVQVLSFTDPLDMTVQIVDTYGQVVSTDSTSFVLVSVADSATCDDQNPYLTGGTTVQAYQGSVAFTQFQAHCKPLLNMSIEFSYIGSDSSSVSYTAANLHFRECKRGEYYSNGECIECSDGTYSILDNSDLSITSCNYCPINSYKCFGSVIEVKAGYWRISDNSSFLSACPFGAKACQQTNGTGEQTCKEGYSGVFCGSCATGYYLETFTSSCKICEASKINVLGVVMIAIATVAVLGFLFNKFWLSIVSMSGLSFLYKQFRNRIQFNIQNEAWKLRRNKLKQIISLFQILTSLPSVLSMIYPQIYTTIVSSFKIINFNFFNDLGLSCRLETFDYVDYLMVNTLSPIALCLFLLTMQQMHVCFWKYRYSAQFHEVLNINSRILATRNAYYTLILMLMYVVLPGVSISIFTMLSSCVDADPDNVMPGSDLYLPADLTLSCTSSRYRFGVTYAKCMILLYPIGIPLFYWTVLRFNKHRIMMNHVAIVDFTERLDPTEEQIHANLVPIQFLFESYKPNYWYFEIIETFRRLLFTGFLTLMYPGSTKQLVIGYFFSVGSITLYSSLRPYVEEDLQFSSLLCQGQLSLLFFITILVKENVAISGVFINILLVMSVFLVFIYEALGAWITPYLIHEDKDDVIYGKDNQNTKEFIKGESIKFQSIKDVEMSNEMVAVDHIELANL